MKSNKLRKVPNILHNKIFDKTHTIVSRSLKNNSSGDVFVWFWRSHNILNTDTIIFPSLNQFTNEF
jgi:hypothetical protein